MLLRGRPLQLSRPQIALAFDPHVRRRRQEHDRAQFDRLRRQPPPGQRRVRDVDRDPVLPVFLLQVVSCSQEQAEMNHVEQRQRRARKTFPPSLPVKAFL